MAAEIPDSKGSFSLDESHILTAAIDFGTTYSGYAYSMKATKDKIMMNKNWGAEVSCESYKTPTCVMTNPDDSFNSFGYQAEDNYNDLDPDEDEIGGPNGYNLYRNFKMLLHNKDVDLKTTVVSTSGHACKAVDIFTMALKYLKDHMLEPIRKSNKSSVEASDIRWILTVPAIWTDESKAFMREAAYKAGLIAEKNSSKLLFALEPEAASIYCRSLDVNLSSGKEDPDEEITFHSEEKVMVIDAGGGTVDIACHEILFDGKVKELTPPSGGPWGGINVDTKFIALLAELFGHDFVNKFKSEKPKQWLKFMTDFERSKKSFVPHGISTIKVALPFDLGKAFEKMQQPQLGAMKKMGIKFRDGTLIIKQESAMKLFSFSVSNTSEHVKALISGGLKPDYALLVGGFGECKVLQHALEGVFVQHNIQLLIPAEPQLAIIKGAVMYGHDPLLIRSRVARYTYGIAVTNSFKEGLHDESKKVIEGNGEILCQDIFSPFVKKGQQVQTGESSIKTYSKQFGKTVIGFTIYKTQRENVMYVDEDGVTKVGQGELLNMTSPDAEVKITYGYTEILLQARETDKEGENTLELTVLA